MSRRWLLLALVTTLFGCTTSVRPTTPFATADAALAAAAQDVDAGRWQKALDTLQAAERQFADAPAIATKHAELAARWEVLRTEWEDRLALVRAQARWEELTLLQRLELAHTGDFLNKLQLEQKRTALLGGRGKLIACARHQLDANLELAQSCADLAHAVRAGVDSRQLREDILAKQRAEAAALQAEQAAQRAIIAAEEAQKRKFATARRSQKLDRAQDLIDEEQYVRALSLVQQVLESEPDNRRALLLQNRLQGYLAKRSRDLNALADRMYSEDNLEAAINIWKASLRLVPDQPEVLDRYKRAKRVRGNLEELLRDGPEGSLGGAGKAKPR